MSNFSKISKFIKSIFFNNIKLKNQRCMLIFTALFIVLRATHSLTNLFKPTAMAKPTNSEKSKWAREPRQEIRRLPQRFEPGQIPPITRAASRYIQRIARQN